MMWGVKEFQELPPEMNRLSGRILGCALRVHTGLGPGLLESVYAGCLAHEMAKAGLGFQRETWMPVEYDGVSFESGFRLDFLVEERVVVELKAVEAIHPVYEAQVLTYLKVTGCRLGLLVNFNVPTLKEGIRRFIR